MEADTREVPPARKSVGTVLRVTQGGSGMANPSGRVSARQAGSLNPNWKGGRVVASNGYVLVKVGKSHHLADVRGYAYEHRVVAEKVIGRRLKAGEQIHHVNGNKQDNKPENLEVVSGIAEHRVRHRQPGSGLQLPGEVNPLILCECGCGERLDKFDDSGRPRRFVSGHNPPASPAQDEVLDALSSGVMSVRSLALRIGKPRSVVGATVYKLLSRKLITRVSRGVYTKAAN